MAKQNPPLSRKPPAPGLLPLGEYDRILVQFSGGKDSLACLLRLLDLGVPREKLELWHQRIDGEAWSSGAAGLMDWPITESYVEAAGAALGIPVHWQWREGGFEREMLRDAAPTASVWYQNPGAAPVELPTIRQTEGTRLRFPQVSADLSVRWCSAYLKIDVAKRVIANDPRLRRGTFLVITGERREESAARSRYVEATDRHPAGNIQRPVHHWRPVIDWTEAEVWEIIERWRAVPHPAYYAGWARCSCMTCIFGRPDQWASVRAIAPERLARIVAYEEQFGSTVNRTGKTAADVADSGHPVTLDTPEVWRRLAMTPGVFTSDLFFLTDDEVWELPAGAYGENAGPT